MGISVLRAVTSFVALSALVARAVRGQLPTSWSRADVISRVEANIDVHLLDGSDRVLGSNGVLSYVKSDVENDAKEIIPDSLSAPSQHIMDMALKPPLFINYRDMEYYGVSVRQYLYSVPLRIAFLEEFPQLTSDEAEAIRKSLKKAADAIQAKMEAALVPLDVTGLTKERIDRSVSTTLGRISDGVGGDPFALAPTVPMSDADIDAMASDFALRLNDSIPLIQEQVGQASRGQLAGKDSDVDIDFMLQRILGTAVRTIREKTTDPRRRNFDMASHAPPGWKEANEEYGRVVMRLMRANRPVAATQP